MTQRRAAEASGRSRVRAIKKTEEKGKKNGRKKKRSRRARVWETRVNTTTSGEDAIVVVNPRGGSGVSCVLLEQNVNRLTTAGTFPSRV